MNDNNGWIKLHRKMLKWQWYKDYPTKSVYLHCLLMANSDPDVIDDMKINRGQYITSLSQLASDLGLTRDQVRHAIDRLVKSGELSSETYRTYRILTVVGYEDYQQPQEMQLASPPGAKAILVPPDDDIKPRKTASIEEVNNRYRNDLANDRSSLEVYCMKLHISPEQAIRYLSIFTAEQNANKKLHTLESDFRSHFSNWLRIQVNTKANNGNNISNSRNAEERDAGIINQMQRLRNRFEAERNGIG